MSQQHENTDSAFQDRAERHQAENTVPKGPVPSHEIGMSPEGTPLRFFVAFEVDCPRNLRRRNADNASQDPARDSDIGNTVPKGPVSSPESTVPKGQVSSPVKSSAQEGAPLSLPVVFEES